MLKGENIIVFSSADWKIGPTSPQHISTNFAEGNKVLFIETFGSRQPSLGPDDMKRIGHRLMNWFKGVEKKTDTKGGQLYIYSPITVLMNFRLPLFINRWLFLNILKRLIKRLNMRNPILYFYLPPPPGIIGRLQEKAVIYHCVDEWATFPAGKNKVFMEAEKNLIENADLVLVANELLYENKKPYARRIHKIYHGVDYGHFAKEFAKDFPLPEDIRPIPRPIIAIIGNFADWMDLDLIRLLAQRHKEWSLVSIGPIDSNVDIKSLARFKNIYFLGQKKYAELPDYYRVIDVFIIPFLLNDHIRYCAPTRLYEHLSSGKPIIATDFPAVREIGEGVIDITLNHEDFIKKIEEALGKEDKSLTQRRKELAKGNTWKARVEEISEITEGILKRKEGQNV